MKRAELFDQARQEGIRREEQYRILHGVVQTADRLRSLWAKAEADAEFRRKYGRRTLAWCEERWQKCKAEAVNKIRLVRGKR